jgi:hypothetical protein
MAQGEDAALLSEIVDGICAAIVASSHATETAQAAQAAE